MKCIVSIEYPDGDEESTQDSVVVSHIAEALREASRRVPWKTERVIISVERES